IRGHSNGVLVIWTIDDRIELVLLIVVVLVDEVQWRIWSVVVLNGRDVFINQRRVDKRIVPRQVPRHPIADNGREFADLQRKTPVLPWCNSNGVLIQANVGALISGIEPAIDSSLREEINLRAQLRVHKQRETRVKEIVGS